MKTPKSFSGRWSRLQSLAVIPIVACLFAMWAGVARSDDGPGLSIQILASNQLSLTVTNGASTNQYEIQRRDAFDELNSWNYHVGGAVGQSNFTVNMGIQQVGFFRAIACVDCDGDGVENWRDADPNDPAVGLLTVTIDSPANGSTIQ